MSIRHSIKCTREEADKFLTDVKNYCLVNNIPFVKMISLTAYEGEVRIYNGNHDTRLSQKRVRQQDDIRESI
jgi:metallophosphoesterase superfamily enzyme